MTARIAPVVYDLILHIPPEQAERGAYAAKQAEAFDAILRDRDIQIDTLMEDIDRIRRQVLTLERNLARAQALL